MKFQLSNCVALQINDLEKAKAFYGAEIGLPIKSNNPEEVEFDTSPIRLFLGNSNKVSGPVTEFLVEDLELARKHLEKNGCEVVDWQGKGKPCYMKDPFGLTFNLYQE